MLIVSIYVFFLCLVSIYLGATLKVICSGLIVQVAFLDFMITYKLTSELF